MGKVVKVANPEHARGIHTSYFGDGDRTKAGHNERLRKQQFYRGKASIENDDVRRELKRIGRI